MGFVVMFLVSSITSPGYADVLLLDGIHREPPNSIEGVPRPKPGMTKANVRKVFGAPIKTTSQVGNPPISRWIYPTYVVVFEGDRVINSVVRKVDLE